MEGKNYFVKYADNYQGSLLTAYPKFKWFETAEEADVWIKDMRRQLGHRFFIIERRFDDLYVALTSIKNLDAYARNDYHPQSTDAAILGAKYEWR